ncbi:MAG: NAD(P)H-hydrate dehydratase [Armatimonadota bacterium]|nr:NAD(P)H-hydrate dehydratase [Armatimonadota bacterium]MDR7403824.1 NAD(P)H-hydrate dehydratase [Armatimonadota bacterium]
MDSVRGVDGWRSCQETAAASENSPGGMHVATAAEIAELDRRAAQQFGVTVSQLMDAAGRRVAQLVAEMLRQRGGRTVVVLAGRGHNGGDGLAAARHLRAAGADVAVVLAAPARDFQGEPARMLEAAVGAGVAVREATDVSVDAVLASGDLVVDALTGTGFRGPARGVVASLIEAAGRCRAPVVAVDVPSGVDADTGRCDGPCVRAAATVTMGWLKPGLLLYPGAEMAGDVYVADIGYPEPLHRDPGLRTHLVDSAMVRALLPPRRPDSHKGTYGRVLVVAGSVGFTGAAVLATRGALRAGAGLVTVAVPQSVYPIVASQVTEGMPTPLADEGGALGPACLVRLEELADAADVVAVGPGLSRTAGVAAVVEFLLGCGRPLVADADALNVLAGRAEALARARGPLVITPHPGELGRLVGRSAAEIQRDRLGSARSASERFRCVVVLKGARTVVAAPDGRAWIVPTGNPGMATGGMGDVLTGAVAALLGQGRDPAEAAYGAAYLHGLAADLLAAGRGQAGMLASEVADGLPAAIAAVQAGRVADPVRVLDD